jgi:membrane protein DedA with SNARE-associated domain
MEPAILVSVMGVLAVVGIYYWWARTAKSPTAEKAPAEADKAR